MHFVFNIKRSTKTVIFLINLSNAVMVPLTSTFMDVIDEIYFMQGSRGYHIVLCFRVQRGTALMISMQRCYAYGDRVTTPYTPP